MNDAPAPTPSRRKETKIRGKYAACCPAEANRMSPTTALTMAGYITGLGPKRFTSRAVTPDDSNAITTAWGRKANPVLTGL